MDKSESITKLSAALVKAQSQMKPAPMNAVNPFLKNKYADLGAIIQTAAPTLNGNGLAYVQTVGGHDDQVSVTTMLIHESGEYISDTVSMATGTEKGKSAAQVAGSIVTYLRRYSLASICGIYADEDTDGSAPASKPAEKITIKSTPEKVWQYDVVQAVMASDARITAPQHAVAMLNMSKVLDSATVTPELATKWTEQYGLFRTTNDDRVQCAADADKTIKE